MSEHFLSIGACGWEHPQWDGDFYPDDLPPEWRLGFYGNEFPVVLIPAQAWQQGSAAVQAWLDETDAAPEFVCEVSAREAQPGDFARSLTMLGMLRDRLAAILLNSDAPAERDLLPYLQQLEQLAPLVLDGAAQDVQEFAAALQPQLQNSLSLAWHGEPAATELLARGKLALARIGADMSEPRALRRVLESLLGAAPGKTRLLLLFDGDPPSIAQMRAAGVILDLL